MSTSETPRARFERVILPRVEKAGHAIDLIGNGASRDYETTPEEIADLLDGLQQKLWEVQRRYAKRLDAPVQIFDTAERVGVEGPRTLRHAPLDWQEPAPATDGDWARSLHDAIVGLNRYRVPHLVASIPDQLLSSVITQLVSRAMDQVEGRAF